MGYSPWSRKESDTTETTEHTRRLCRPLLVQPRLGLQPFRLNQRWGNFPAKGQTVNSLGFVSHAASVLTTQQCCRGVKAATDGRQMTVPAFQ